MSSREPEALGREPNFNRRAESQREQSGLIFGVLLPLNISIHLIPKNPEFIFLKYSSEFTMFCDAGARK